MASKAKKMRAADNSVTVKIESKPKTEAPVAGIIERTKEDPASALTSAPSRARVKHE